MRSAPFRMLCAAALLASFASPCGEAQTGPVIWGLVPNAPPTTYVDAAGKPTGFFVELYSRIMDELGIEYEFRIASFQELYPRLVSGEIDFFTTLLKNPEREALFVFPDQGISAGWSQLFVAHGTVLQSVLDLQHKKIGVVTDDRNGASFHEYIDSLAIPCEIVEYPDFDQLVLAVAEGEAFGGVQSSWFVSAERRVQPTTVVFAPFKAYPVLSRRSARRPEFEAVNARFARLVADPDSYYFELQRKWLGHERTETTVIPAWLIAASATLLAASVLSAFAIRTLTARLRRVNADLERKVEERSARLTRSEKLAALGNLAAGLAHELNSPLQTLRFAAEGLAEEEVSAPLSEGESALVETILGAARSARPAARADTGTLREILAPRLASAGLPIDGETARRLADLGIPEPDARTLALVRDAPEDVLRAARGARARDAYREALKDSLGRIDTIVQALRIYTHRDHRGVPAEADIAKQVDAVLALSANRLRSGIRVVREFAGLPPYRCYAEKLQQVWMALIDNALDAMGEEGTLTIRGSSGPEGVSVSVEDTGPGIPENLADRVFEPFFTTKPAGEGSGLGLATVSEIVRTHRGSLTFDSRPGRTVFTVNLPAAGIVRPTGSAGRNHDA